VRGVTDAVAITAGVTHSCAVLKHGTARCWGSNDHGELGNGTTSRRPTTRPAHVNGVRDAVAITAGRWHTCALLKNGSVKCWGEADRGQLDSDGKAIIVAPGAGLIRGVAIGAKGDHACPLLTDDTVRCWGDGFEGPKKESK